MVKVNKAKEIRLDAASSKDITGSYAHNGTLNYSFSEGKWKVIAFWAVGQVAEQTNIAAAPKLNDNSGVSPGLSKSHSNCIIICLVKEPACNLILEIQCGLFLTIVMNFGRTILFLNFLHYFKEKGLRYYSLFACEHAKRLQLCFLYAAGGTTGF